MMVRNTIPVWSCCLNTLTRKRDTSGILIAKLHSHSFSNSWRCFSFIKLYANSFTCSNFNADEIALLAKSAGMKYLVITIKHHDGFVMYPTKFTEWNIANSAAKGKDIINEIQNACVRNGLKFGVYFSQNID